MGTESGLSLYNLRGGRAYGNTLISHTYAYTIYLPSKSQRNGNRHKALKHHSQK